MKANEAPTRIYVDNPNHDFWYRTKNENSIEYTRTDAFIEKACDAFCKKCKMPNCRSNECKMISDFKGHLETI